MHPQRESEGALRTMRRALEVGLGLVLLVALLVPVAAIVAIASDLLDATDDRHWAMWLVPLPMGALAYFCLITGWRLLSGRPRSDGGLLHPWFFYAAGVYATWHGAARGLALGPEFAQPHYNTAAAYFEMARERRRNRRPDRPLRSTSGETEESALDGS
jgi:hypothetical protein